MRSSIIIVLLFSVLSMLSAQRWNSDHNYVTQDRDVPAAFDYLEVSSAIVVEISQGSQHAISIKADEDVIDYIKTEVSGGQLSIYVTNWRLKRNNLGKMLVRITMPELTGIEAGGASRVTTLSAFSGEELRLDVGGAAQVDIQFSGSEVMADVGGAGTIELSGRADRVSFDASSAGSIRAEDLEAKIAKVDASSASTVHLTATEEIDAEASSAASIRYSGNPKKVFTDTSSAGSIRG